MMREALGRLGEGWAWAETCICKDLEQGVRFSAVYGYCSGGGFPSALECKRRDLRGVGSF